MPIIIWLGKRCLITLISAVKVQIFFFWKIWFKKKKKWGIKSFRVKTKTKTKKHNMNSRKTHLLGSLHVSTRNGKEHCEPHLWLQYLPEQNVICTEVHFQDTNIKQSNLSQGPSQTCSNPESSSGSVQPWTKIHILGYWSFGPAILRSTWGGSFLTRRETAIIDFGADLTSYF